MRGEDIRCIDEHTFDRNLLSGRLAIDAGCRGWLFSIAMKGFGCETLALDIENFYPDVHEGIHFQNVALWDKPEYIDAHFFGNGTANFLKGINGVPYNGPDRPSETKQVRAFTLKNVIEWCNCKEIDILKCDIEGSEYGVLMNITEDLLPRQISCEFHPHCHTELHDKMYVKVLEHLAKWYDISFHSQYPQYPSMDTLFTLRDAE